MPRTQFAIFVLLSAALIGCRSERRGEKLLLGDSDGLRPTSNTIVHGEVPYPIDTEKSEIVGYYNAETGDFAWVIKIKADESALPEGVPSVWLESPPMGFDEFERFSDIEQEAFFITYEHDEVHPILPGNPGNFFTGVHAFPNVNEIDVAHVRDNVFRIIWEFSAETTPDLASSVRLDTEIAVKQIVVWSDDSLDIDVATDAMAEHFSALKIISKEVEESLVKFVVTQKTAR